MNANDFPPELLSQQQARRAAAQESEKSRPSAPVPNSDVLFRQEVYRIVNFKRAKLEWERIVLERQRA